MSKKILMIHTGGTLGMAEGKPDNSLKPVQFQESVVNFVPELNQLADIETVFAFNIDSANLTIKHINKLVEVIKENYELYDGFVIIHGTDAMAYSGSALSFLIKNNKKPIILTGSQKPLRHIRTDARLNLINAVEFATMDIPEVAICFNSKLMRANRATKVSSGDFDAFDSPNFPYLATVGVEINLNNRCIMPISFGGEIEFNFLKEKNIVHIKTFPGLNPSIYRHFLNNDTDGIIVEAYATGNIPILENSLIPFIIEANELGIPVIITSQAKRGKINLDAYECGRKAKEAGAISALDMTIESAIMKFQYLLSKDYNVSEIKKLFLKNISGEISE
ncbi:asparaginase [Thermotomaculum hydrothermale]|nr:asparaginase [Thermotomaculum hydrothermale]